MKVTFKELSSALAFELIRRCLIKGCGSPHAAVLAANDIARAIFRLTTLKIEIKSDDVLDTDRVNVHRGLEELIDSALSNRNP